MNIARPIDVATRHTLAFLSSALRPSSAIIEVGCGAGDVAVALRDAGHAVIALDADAGNVAAATARGVATVVARWPECAGTPADAIAFTRSLHHIAPLAAAVSHARTMLRDDGRLLVEDFAHERAGARDVAWLRDQLVEARSRGLLAHDTGGFARALLEADDPMAAWRRNHVGDHAVHPGGAMRAAIAEVFGETSESTAPYLYRYPIPWLANTHESTAWIEALIEDERRLIARGELRAIGLRFVATRAPRAMRSPTVR